MISNGKSTCPKYPRTPIVNRIESPGRKNPKKSPVSTKITSGTTHTFLRPSIRVGLIVPFNTRTKLDRTRRLFDEPNPKMGATSSLCTTSIAGKKLATNNSVPLNSPSSLNALVDLASMLQVNQDITQSPIEVRGMSVQTKGWKIEPINRPSGSVSVTNERKKPPSPPERYCGTIYRTERTKSREYPRPKIRRTSVRFIKAHRS
jgi:hypothetical protein